MFLRRLSQPELVPNRVLNDINKKFVKKVQTQVVKKLEIKPSYITIVTIEYEIIKINKNLQSNLVIAPYNMGHIIWIIVYAPISWLKPSENK